MAAVRGQYIRTATFDATIQDRRAKEMEIGNPSLYTANQSLNGTAIQCDDRVTTDTNFIADRNFLG